MIRKDSKIRNPGKALAMVLLLACLISPLPRGIAAGTGEVAITVRQDFTSLGTPPNDTFRYLLSPREGTPLRAAGVNADGSFSITGTADKSITFSFIQAGVYEYDLLFTTPPGAGYALSREVYSLKMTVYNDLAFTLLIRKSNGEKDAVIEYSHFYDAAGGPLPSDPDRMPDTPVVNTVIGDPPAPGIFAYRLEAVNSSRLIAENLPMVEAIGPAACAPEGANGVKTVEILGSGRAAFAAWAYTAEGTYRYKVSQVNPDAEGYVFDPAVYTITDTVADLYGQLTLARVVTDDTRRQVSSMNFLNTYVGGPSPPPTLEPTREAPPEATPGTEIPTATSGEDIARTGEPFPTALIFGGVLLFLGAILFILLRRCGSPR